MLNVSHLPDIRIQDLTYFSNTLPDPEAYEIDREHIIKNIEQTFQSNNKVILIEGLDGTGKTTLLSQFVRKHRSNCISFFIGDDYWMTDVSYFLRELCNQMIHVCSEGLKRHTSHLNIEELKVHELVQIFPRLYTDICKQSKRNGEIYYIVIDGIDKIDCSTEEDSILKYLPLGNSSGVYILLSSSKDRDYNFNYFPLRAPFFSKHETSLLLKDYLTEEEIEQVYEASDGMQGYVIEILRLLKSSKPKQEVINYLPPSFNRLLDNIWESANKNEPELVKILAVMTFSPEILEVKEIAEILGITEFELLTLVEEMSFIIEKESKLDLPSVYKNYFKEKLLTQKTDALQLLISFYVNNSNITNAMIYLPELYHERKEYDPLVNLISTDNIYSTMKKTQQMAPIRNNLRTLSNMAQNNSDWGRLSWSILTESVFTQISNTPPAIEDQVKALLSLNLYKDALKIAYQCALPEDRLTLLSNVCAYMKQNNIMISEDITNSLEESIALIDNTVDLSEQLINKLIDISSNLFFVDVTLSLNLLKRIVNKTGEKLDSKQLLDYLLVRLLLRVDRENEDLDQIKSQIGNNDIQNIFNNFSGMSNDIDEDRIINQVELIKDISAALFYLQNWCENNKKDREVSKVVGYAFDAMISNNEYSPTLRQIRKFAETLLFSNKVESIKPLISKIENLQSTLIKKPFEEYIRIQLTLAKLEKQWSSVKAEERYLLTYFSLDDIEDLDIKCIVIIHLLEAHKNLMDHDKKLLKELKEQLIKDYNILITSSADHFKVTKKIIRKLTEIDNNLAYRFASKLNTQHRIYLAYAEIIKTYLKKDNIDFTFIKEIFNNIDEKYYKDWLLVQVLKTLTSSKKDIPENIMNSHFGEIKQIKSVRGKTIAFAYYLNIIYNNEEKSSFVFNEMLNSFDKIDDLAEKMRIGYRIVQILSTTHQGYAQEFYYNISNNYQKNNNFDTRLQDLYCDIINLLIRMVPDILKSEDFIFKVKQIKNIILSIPSPSQQCKLLSSLALRCSVHGHRGIVEEIAEQCSDISEKAIDDYDSYIDIIITIAPLLYEYEKSLFHEKLESLNSISLKDKAIRSTILFIISKRPNEDPLDIKSFQQKINYPDAIKICELLDYISTDTLLFSMIASLVDALVEPSTNKKYNCKLKEKQLLSLTERISNIIESKLPDKKNIKHEGYKLTSYGYLCKLRDNSSQRAIKRWDSLFPSRSALKKRAELINNTADKIFVLASLGKTTYFIDQSTGISFIKEAENHLKFLSNPLDRAERYELIAEAYHKTSNSMATKFLLEQAMSYAQMCTHEQGKDQLIGGLLDLAHSIDPDLAQRYASSFESNDSSLNLNDLVLTLNLHSAPQKINNYKKNQTDNLLFDFFSRMLKTICSGRGTTQHSEVIGKYLGYSVGHSFKTINLGISWFIENTINGNSNVKKSELSDLFLETVKLLELIKTVEISIYDNNTSFQGENLYKVLTETNIHTFNLNEQEEAFNLIKKWLYENSDDYIKIHDPYFNEEMLCLLKNIQPNTRVMIYTSEKDDNVINLPTRYKNYWKMICGQNPPETHFSIYSTSTGETPLHDRFIIGSKLGLQLGTSLNGFGGKISTITFLDFTQKEKIEKDIINPLITMPPTEYKNKKLTLKTFSL